MNNHQRNWRTTVVVVTIGALLAIVVPLSLLPVLPFEYLKEYGTVGDTIGGISNPITGLAGIILLFLALTAQLRANALTQKQVDADAEKEVRQHVATHLHQLYAFMDENIKQFNYQKISTQELSSEQLHGRRAIRQFIDDIESMNIDLHDSERLLQQDGVREILGVLEIAKQAFVKIASSDIDPINKDFYAALVKHVLLYSVFPYTDLDTSDGLTLAVCNQCGQPHGNYPPAIFDRLQDLKRYF